MKNTKRALLVSLVSIVLCLSMLVGSTFAWFTDTATTAVNVIQAGTIDIRLTDKDGNDMEGKTLKWVDAKGNSDILWEPGCTFITEPVTLWNHSNLSFALKTYIEGFDGDTKLLEVLDIKIVDADKIRNEDGSLKPFDEITESYLKQFTDAYGGFPMQSWQYGLQADWTTESEGVQTAHPGKGEPKPIENVCIVAHMKEEAGNDYQGLKLTGAALIFTASQLSDENDSYGDEYDSDAPYDRVFIGTQVYNEDAILTQHYYARYGDEAIHVSNDGTEVTIQSSTTVKLYPDGATMDGIYVRDASTLNIKGGTFVVEGTAASRCNLIYAYDGATINISGGTFKSIKPETTLYVNDNSEIDPSSITVIGGTFFEFDPSAEHYGVTVPAGYKVVTETKADGTWYTVVAE